MGLPGQHSNRSRRQTNACSSFWRRRPEGVSRPLQRGRPCDNHFEACMNSTEVMSLLQPKPIAVRLSDEPPSKKPRLDKPSPDKAPFEKPGKGRNKGKGKATPSQFMRIPTELLSLGCTGATPQGHRLCFSFNLKKCSNSVQNQRCDKGLHLCAVKGCFKQHAAVECPMKKKD